MRVRLRGGWAIATLLVAAAGAAPPSAGAHPTVTDITFRYKQYTPSVLRVEPGSTVTWAPEPNSGNTFNQLDGPNGHPLDFEDPSIPDQTSGAEKISRTFPAAGRFAFVCLNHGSVGMAGSVTVSANHPPVATFTAPPSAPQQTAVLFDASASIDPDPGQTLSYAWDFDGDGAADQAGPEPTATHVYSAAGTFTVGLRVTDSNSDFLGPESTLAGRAITITPSTTGGGSSGGGGPGIGPAPRDGPPTVALAIAGRPTLRTLRRSGIGLRASSSEPGLAVATLRRGARLVGRGVAGFTAPGARTIRVRLTPAGRKALARVRRATLALTLVVTDAAGNETRVTRAVVLRR